MSALNPPLFERLAPLLAPFNLAELHGLLCGLLCTETDLEPDRWLRLAHEALAEDVELAAPVRDVLAKFLDYGTAQLNDPDGAISLLLPDDDVPLQERADALGNWCQGLLYGLGVGRVEQRGDLSKESREFLHDVADIARADVENSASSEADEIAYAEVVEYLRIGLQLIYQDVYFAAPPVASSPH